MKPGLDTLMTEDLVLVLTGSEWNQNQLGFLSLDLVMLNFVKPNFLSGLQVDRLDAG